MIAFSLRALRTESHLLCPKKVPGRPPLCLVECTRGRRLVPKQLRLSPLKIRLRRRSIRHDDDRTRSSHTHTHKLCAFLTLASLDRASAGRAADGTLPRFSLWLCSERLCSSAILPEVVASDFQAANASDLENKRDSSCCSQIPEDSLLETVLFRLKRGSSGRPYGKTGPNGH
jgi:hypothetical protein